MTLGTQDISKIRLVNGAATDASASESEIPTSAAFKAPQSLAPSPQNPQELSRDCSFSTRTCFSSGDIRAKTLAFNSTCKFQLAEMNYNIDFSDKRMYLVEKILRSKIYNPTEDISWYCEGVRDEAVGE